MKTQAQLETQAQAQAQAYEIANAKRAVAKEVAKRIFERAESEVMVTALLAIAEKQRAVLEAQYEVQYVIGEMAKTLIAR